MSLTNRRNFLRLSASVVGAGILGYHSLKNPSRISAQEGKRGQNSYEGVNFTDWEVVVGDGIYAAPGQAAVSASDIKTINRANYSELQANVAKRRIMAHNITFKRIIDDNALNFVHTCSYNFRLPYLPSKSNRDMNAQTVEGGVFVWDGSKTRLDYGTGFQWILNPFDKNFGSLRAWDDTAKRGWVIVGQMTPDTEWHEVKMVVDFRRETTSLLIDGVHQQSRFAKIPKPATWGTETAARFQAEIISIYPGEKGLGALHKVEYKDWRWIWEPYI